MTFLNLNGNSVVNSFFPANLRFNSESKLLSPTLIKSNSVNNGFSTFLNLNGNSEFIDCLPKSFNLSSFLKYLLPLITKANLVSNEVWNNNDKSVAKCS